jgi:hypothetical protein
LRRKQIEPGQLITVRMSRRDQELIKNLVAADPDYAARLHDVPGESHLAGEYTLDDLEDLLGHVAADANHAESAKLRRQLDALYDRLLVVQRSYDDGSWADSAG